jgi:hypothetical protein
MTTDRDDKLADLIGLIVVPPESPEFFPRLRERAARSRRQRLLALIPLPTSGRQGRIAVVAATAIFSLAAGVAIGATAPNRHDLVRPETPRTATATAPPVLTFEPASGWNVVQTALSATLSNTNQVAWAANVPIASPDSPSGWGVTTARSLPADGIEIFASGSTQVDTPSEYPTRSLPLNVTDGEFHTGQYENQPAPNVSWYGPVTAKVNGTFVLVNVYFGTPNPTQDLLAQAQDELNRLSAPPPASF